ncbi:MAG: hypothetical protein ACLFTV_02140 [Desulfococcaceae bacterium]
MTENGKRNSGPETGGPKPTAPVESSPDDAGKTLGGRPAPGVLRRFLNWLIRGAERSRRDRGRCPT